MGLSSLPAPSSGFLCILLVNTAFSISIFKAVLRSILHVFGVEISSPCPLEPLVSIENCSESIEFNLDVAPAIRFEEAVACKFAEHECSVCLTQFEPKSETNYLSCGHLFHKMCLNKWFAYSNFTCPLCRNPLMAEEESSSFW